MDNIIYKFLTFSLVVFLSFNLTSQSIDPPTAKSVVIGNGHAVLKVETNDYLDDSTEIKLKNMTSDGFGTEFVIKSLNEEGLSINSNSDLANNTRDSIMHFGANGDVYIGDFKGGGTRPLFVNDGGQIIVGCPTTYTAFETDLTSFTTATENFEAVGTAYSFTKNCQLTHLKIRLSDRLYYDEVNEIAAQIQVRVNGLVPDYVSTGSVWESNVPGSNRLNSWFSTESIYENLTSGTYTIQMYVKVTPNGGDGIVDPGNFKAAIIVEEGH